MSSASKEAGTAKPKKPTIGEAQPCPVCGYHIPPSFIVISPPQPADRGRWTCRIRLYCEICDGVSETWYECRTEPWRKTGRRRWYDGKSKALLRMQRDLASRAGSGIRTG